MTNEYYARRVPIEELAAQRVAQVAFSDNSGKKQGLWYKNVTSDGTWFNDFFEAVKHETEWLKLEKSAD